MSRLRDIVRRIRVDLEEADVPFALVGALAVSVRAEPRFTRDVDPALAVSDDRQAESLVFSLRQRGYGVAVERGAGASWAPGHGKTVATR